ncbi:hypothetical protein D4S61_20955, partial [Salmonella enterica]|nr:hypothetical protein [Salmonella enterica]
PDATKIKKLRRRLLLACISNRYNKNSLLRIISCRQYSRNPFPFLDMENNKQCKSLIFSSSNEESYLVK